MFFMKQYHYNKEEGTFINKNDFLITPIILSLWMQFIYIPNSPYIFISIIDK